MVKDYRHDMQGSNDCHEHYAIRVSGYIYWGAFSHRLFSQAPSRYEATPRLSLLSLFWSFTLRALQIAKHLLDTEVSNRHRLMLYSMY